MIKVRLTGSAGGGPDGHGKPHAARHAAHKGLVYDAPAIATLMVGSWSYTLTTGATPALAGPFGACVQSCVGLRPIFHAVAFWRWTLTTKPFLTYPPLLGKTGIHSSTTPGSTGASASCLSPMQRISSSKERDFDTSHVYAMLPSIASPIHGPRCSF